MLSLADRLYGQYLLKTSRMPVCYLMKECDNYALVNYLIEQGAELNQSIVGHSEVLSFVPLSYARIYERYYSLLTLLKAGANIDTVSIKKQTTELYENLSYNQVKPISVMRLYLHFGANPTIKNKDGKDCDCYQLLSKKPIMLKRLKTIYARVLQIKSHQQIAAQAFQEKNEVLAAKAHKQLADLYLLDVNEEHEAPFREYYMTEVMKHLSKALEVTTEPKESINLLNKLGGESMRSFMHLLSKKPFFYPDVEQVIENLQKKVSVIEKQNDAEEALSKLYDILAELYGIIEQQDHAMKYAVKSAELTPTLQREAYMVTPAASSSNSEQGSSTGSDLSSHSGSEEEGEATPFLHSNAYEKSGPSSYPTVFEKGKSALRKRRAHTEVLQREDARSSHGVKF